MGLINFIREKLPEPLDVASRKLKMKEQLIQRINSAVPKCYKNKYHYKEGISKARAILFHWDRGTPIYNLIDMEGATEAGVLDKWKRLEEIARNYKELCA